MPNVILPALGFNLRLVLAWARTLRLDDRFYETGGYGTDG